MEDGTIPVVIVHATRRVRNQIPSWSWRLRKEEGGRSSTASVSGSVSGSLSHSRKSSFTLTSSKKASSKSTPSGQDWSSSSTPPVSEALLSETTPCSVSPRVPSTYRKHSNGAISGQSSGPNVGLSSGIGGDASSVDWMAYGQRRGLLTPYGVDVAASCRACCQAQVRYPCPVIGPPSRS